MRASILLTTLATAAAACAVSPDVTPYPADAQNGMPDAPGPGPGEDAGGPGPDARPMSGDAGGPGVDATPGSMTVGWPEPFGTRFQISEGMLFAFRLPTIQAGTALDAWGIIPADGSDARIYMALYADRAGEPGNLVSWTEEWSASEREYRASGTPLPAGDYWLVVITEPALEIGYDPVQMITACLRQHPFGAPFDADFGSSDSCPTLEAPNVYIRVLPTP